MRKSIVCHIGAACVLALAGCAAFSVYSHNIVETQSQNVQGCERLGVVSEIADPGKIISMLDRKQMVDRVKVRSAEIGATHIVWEYRTNDAVSATAYRCQGVP